MLIGTGILKSIFSVRKIVISVSTILFFILVSLVTNSILNAFKINYITYNSSAERVLRKSEQISKQVKDFSETATLTELGANPLNGFYYRFDENLIYARPTGKNFKRRGSDQNFQSIHFEFNTRDDLPLRPLKKDFIIENGILKYKHDKANFLESFEALNIDKDSIGEIEVRLKVNKTKKIILGWSNHPEASALDPFQTDYLTLWTIPDNQFHTYRVDAQPVFEGTSKAAEPIRKLFLFPFETPFDEVEIDYLRFISKTEKYAQKTLWANIRNEEQRDAKRHLYAPNA
jgi:hypothetical protein